MIPVMDAARFIINYSNQKNYQISNLRLNKLLYFIQVYYLAFTDEKQPCFLEDLVAWDVGPVVPEVFQQFKRYGAFNIPPVHTFDVFDIPDNRWSIRKVVFSDSCIPENDQKRITYIVDLLNDFTDIQLGDAIHRQRSWIRNHKTSSVIAKEELQKYFLKKKERKSR